MSWFSLTNLSSESHAVKASSKAVIKPLHSLSFMCFRPAREWKLYTSIIFKTVQACRDVAGQST